MSIKTQSIAKYNYTGRKRIKQKPELIEIVLVDRAAESAMLKVSWDREAILDDLKVERDVEADLVLDVLFLGNSRRYELHHNDETAELRIDDCPDDAVLDFRLKLVSTDSAERGRLLAASSAMKLKSGGGDEYGGQVSSGFFHPEKSDNLGSQIFRVTWQADGDPAIFVNRQYHNRFEKTASYAAHLYPEIVRQVMTGILLRNDDLESVEQGSGSDDWLLFVYQKLGIQLRGPEAEHVKDVPAKLDLIDRIVEAFADQKWRNDKTLLEAVL